MFAVLPAAKRVRGAYHLLWQPLTFDISGVDDSQGVTHLEQKMFDAPPPPREIVSVH